MSRTEGLGERAPDAAGVGERGAVEGERRPWHRMAEVVEHERLGGPYALARVVLGNGSQVTVAGSCRVPTGSVAPPAALLSWRGQSAEGAGR